MNFKNSREVVDSGVCGANPEFTIYYLLFTIHYSEFIICLSVSPISAGLSATAMPVAWSAAILSAAVPLPPEMMAPAWPIRRPGGAVRPAMNPTTGFLTFALMNAAAS